MKCIVRIVCFCLIIIGQIKAQGLKGTHWQLVSIDYLETGVSKQIGEKLHASLSFDSDSAYSGRFCNHFSGRFKYDHKDHIKMTVPMGTHMTCLGVEPFEQELFIFLSQAKRYRVEGDKLFIITTHQGRLQFKKA